MKKLISFIICIFLILFYNQSFAGEITLPPDPGKTGKKTLLGIDSDNDGVRDDIQRYIYLTYPKEEKMCLALLQIAKIFQELLSNASDPEISHNNVKRLYCSLDCLDWIKGDFRKAIKISDALRAEMLNTRERSLTYIKFNNSLAGKTTSLPSDEQVQKCCPFYVNNAEKY